MKKALVPQSLTTIKESSKYIDAFIIPLDNYSINYPYTFSLNQIKEIKKENKEIFIMLNKNIHNNELKNLREQLQEIEKLNINGIIFYDIAIINLKKKLKLKTPLVWNQEHLVTNYATINYWYNKGCEYAYLSSELTKREIEEIKENTKAKIFINVFGHIPMFTSKRHLVNNYSKYFSLKKDIQNTKIYKEGKYYPIIDSKDGTTVFSNYILNIENIINADYLVYNSYLINDITEVLKNNKYEKETGFLYKETIYKVK